MVCFNRQSTRNSHAKFPGFTNNSRANRVIDPSRPLGGTWAGYNDNTIKDLDQQLDHQRAEENAAAAAANPEGKRIIHDIYKQVVKKDGVMTQSKAIVTTFETFRNPSPPPPTTAPIAKGNESLDKGKDEENGASALTAQVASDDQLPKADSAGFEFTTAQAFTTSRVSSGSLFAQDGLSIVKLPLAVISEETKTSSAMISDFLFAEDGPIVAKLPLAVTSRIAGTASPVATNTCKLRTEASASQVVVSVVASPIGSTDTVLKSLDKFAEVAEWETAIPASATISRTEQVTSLPYVPPHMRKVQPTSLIAESVKNSGNEEELPNPWGLSFKQSLPKHTNCFEFNAHTSGIPSITPCEQMKPWQDTEVWKTAEELEALKAQNGVTTIKKTTPVKTADLCWSPELIASLSTKFESQIPCSTSLTGAKSPTLSRTSSVKSFTIGKPSEAMESTEAWKATSVKPSDLCWSSELTASLSSLSHSRALSPRIPTPRNTSPTEAKPPALSRASSVESFTIAQPMMKGSNSTTTSRGVSKPDNRAEKNSQSEVPKPSKLCKWASLQKFTPATMTDDTLSTIPSTQQKKSTGCKESESEITQPSKVAKWDVMQSFTPATLTDDELSTGPVTQQEKSTTEVGPALIALDRWESSTEDYPASVWGSWRKRSDNSKANIRDGSTIGGSSAAIGEECKGHAMMAKMGWVSGTGLGSASTGRLEPIVTVVRTTKRGLGAEEPIQPARKAKSGADDWEVTAGFQNSQMLPDDHIGDWEIEFGVTPQWIAERKALLDAVPPWPSKEDIAAYNREWARERKSRDKESAIEKYDWEILRKVFNGTPLRDEGILKWRGRKNYRFYHTSDVRPGNPYVGQDLKLLPITESLKNRL